MLHAQLDRAHKAGQILSCYKETSNFTTPIINQVEFEKSVNEDKIPFVLDNVMKSYSSDMMKKLEAEKDIIKKSELDEQIQTELSVMRKVNVVFDSVVKSVWVDIVDPVTKLYKDNSLTKKLNIAGKAA